MRKLILAIVLLLSLVFIFINLAEVEAVVETLQRGDWRFILLAFSFQAVWMVTVAACFREVYRAMGLNESRERLVLLVAAANFFNIVAPSGGVGGISVFVTQARKRGYSSARVTVAGAVVVLFDYLAFLCILLLGLIVLLRRHNLNVAELIASAAFLAVAVLLVILIYKGMHSADSLAKALAWMARQVNRFLLLFIHRKYLSEKRAHSFAYDAADGLQRLRREPRSLMIPFALSLTSKTLLILILLSVFVAFKVPFSIGTLIGGFSIGYLFMIVSTTPAGIGFVEGFLTIGLTSLNVPLSEATVITLAYRGVTFWVPLLFGMWAFRWLSHEKQVLAAVQSE
jgi:hypothetical protein